MSEAAAQQQAIARGGIVRSERNAAAAQVVGRRAQHTAIGREPAGDEARAREGADADGHVDARADQIDDGIAEVDVEREAWVLRAQTRQEWREVQATEGDGDADAQRAADVATRLAQTVGRGRDGVY